MHLLRLSYKIIKKQEESSRGIAKKSAGKGIHGSNPFKVRNIFHT